MSSLVAQRAGGKAKAKKIWQEYKANPNFCLFCKVPILKGGPKTGLSDLRKKKFCNQSCAAKLQNSSKIKSDDHTHKRGIDGQRRAYKPCIRCGNPTKWYQYPESNRNQRDMNPLFFR